VVSGHDFRGAARQLARLCSSRSPESVRISGPSDSYYAQDARDSATKEHVPSTRSWSTSRHPTEETRKAHMTAQSEAVNRPAEWQTGSLRLTAFYLGRLDPGAEGWWQSLTGQPSESKNVRPAMGQLTERGTVQGRTLQLQVNPGRIDWLHLPEEGPETEGFPVLGDFANAVGDFRSLVSAWLPQAPPLNRLAFGAQLLIAAQDQESATKIIAQTVRHVQMDWTGVRDFVFQLNRPKPCLTNPSLGPINRLVKWQSIVRRKIVATLLPEPHVPVATTEDVAACWELDLSTAIPQNDKMVLAPELLEGLLSELTDGAMDIVLKGDVP
jgi:hypothetical protein